MGMHSVHGANVLTRTPAGSWLCLSGEKPELGWRLGHPPKVTVADISQGGWSSAGNVVGLLWNSRTCQYLGVGAKEEMPRNRYRRSSQKVVTQRRDMLRM